MENKLSTWAVLSSIDCSEHTETKGEGKNKLTYLSWAWAWGIVKGKYQDASYSVREWDDRPYLYDQDLGYMVETSVTICGETIRMRLPVMNGANKAMKSVAYSYYVNSYENGKPKKVEKVVEAATMFDINTAIMRCLTKNLAMFGLGHYIYAGEDLPTVADEVFAVERDKAITHIQELTSSKELIEYCNEVKARFGHDEQFRANARKMLATLKNKESLEKPINQ